MNRKQMLDEFQEVLDDIEENGFDLDEMIAEINKDQEALLDSLKKIEASQRRKGKKENAQMLRETNNNLAKNMRKLKDKNQEESIEKDVKETLF